jgi:hypothetical protein
MDYENFDATYIHQTEGAVLFEIEGEEIWVPKSALEDGGKCVKDFDPDNKGDEVEVSIAQWLCKDRGLL